MKHPEALTAEQIIEGYTARDIEANRAALRAAVVDGQYITERDSMFLKHYSPKENKLSGELLLVDKGTRCRVVRTVGQDHILIRYTDSRHRHWFAWIHA